MQYARLAVSKPTFRFPEDPLAMSLTCWHISARTMERVQAFVQTEAEEDLFFLMFAHGYEFDFGTKESDPDARLAVEAGTAHFYKGKATAL